LSVLLVIHSLTGTLDDAPELADYVRQLSDLRRHTAHCTTEAQFEDTTGLHRDGAEAKLSSLPAGDPRPFRFTLMSTLSASQVQLVPTAHLLPGIRIADARKPESSGS
jgi:hypothetical protein